MNEIKNKKAQEKEQKSTAFFVIIAIAICVIIGITLCTMIRVVPAGHVGVYDLFGKVNDIEKQPGLQFKNPLASITTMSVKTQEYTMSIIEGEGNVYSADTISALTKEGLTVDLDVTVWYRLESSKATEIYKTVGLNYVNILVRPKIRESIRSVIAKYEAKTVYSDDREKVQLEIQQAIEKDLINRGIKIEKVLLRNVQLPAKVRTAIEEKLQAEQESQRMVFILTKETQEAERKRLEARGIADANDIIAGSLTHSYLTWYWITNLDKHASVIYVPIGESGMPMFKNIDNYNSTG